MHVIWLVGILAVFRNWVHMHWYTHMKDMEPVYAKEPVHANDAMEPVHAMEPD